MTQSIFLSTPTLNLPLSTPSSPDPTPLRMLAFSVAEAALQSDPNSPLFVSDKKMNKQLDVTEDTAWAPVVSVNGGRFGQWKGGNGKGLAERRGRLVWDVVDKAKERKGHTFPESSLPISPPISPASYTFVIPPSSQLAASIARSQSEAESQPKPALSVSTTSSTTYRPLYTQSAAPSPIRSTFYTLDQTRPPPEFVPRLPACEFSKVAEKQSVEILTAAARRRSSCEALKPEIIDIKKGAKVKGRLPSLQQIQAKLKRSESVSNLPIRPRMGERESSDEVLEIIQTPDEEVSVNPILRDRRLALKVLMNRRPPTPPSPNKEARLLPFLRERTNGRLAGNSGNAIASQDDIDKPVLKITPPTLENRPPVAPLDLGKIRDHVTSPTRTTFSPFKPVSGGYTTPTETRFNLPSSHLSTPPSARSFSSSTSPTSPTASIRSATSTTGTGSPTISIPSITCTPAPSLVVRDGIEQDSDDGSDCSEEVMLFDGEAFEREKVEREKRSAEMLARLQRRRSLEI